MSYRTLLVILCFLSLTAISTGVVVTEPSTHIPSPWEIGTEIFRAGGTVIARANVTNGDPSSVNLTITTPEGATSRTDMFERDDGTYQRQYQVDDGAPEGTWTVNVTAWDGTPSWNSTTFSVSEPSTATIVLNRTMRPDEEEFVDGVAASSAIYTDLSFPYGVGISDGVVNGLIGYGDVQSLGYRDGAYTVINVTHDMDDAVSLLPLASISIPRLDQMTGMFDGGTSEANSFLNQERPAFGYEHGAEKRIRVTLQTEDSIRLDGFTGGLGGGFHELSIRNEGEREGQTKIVIER